MGQLAHHGREVAVDVVQVHHIGLEVVEHCLKAVPHVVPAQHALQGAQLIAQAAAEAHLAGKSVLIVAGRFWGYSIANT